MKPKTALIFLLVAAFLFFFMAPLDSDLGWHIRYGQQLIQYHNPWRHNLLTVFLENHYWPQSYSGYQILVYFLFQRGRLWGLALFNSLLFMAIFYLLYQLCRKKILYICLTTPFVILLSWPVISGGFRAQLLSLLWFLLTIWCLKTIPVKKLVPLLPAISFLWTNTHGSFPYLFLLLSFWWLSFLWQKKYVNAGWLALTSIFCFLTSLINPFFLDVWQTSWEHFRGYDLSQSIAEWTKPPFLFQAIILLTSILALVKFFSQPRAKKFPYLLLILVFAFQSLKARRDLPFFAFGLSIWGQSFFDQAEKRLNWLILPLVTIFFAFGLVRSLSQIKIMSDWQTYCRAAHNYPLAAINFIKQKGIKGIFFNNYEWGGFLEWQLPESKFFIDGRMSAWKTGATKDPYHYFLDIIQTQPGWQEQLDQYRINYIIITKGTFLDLKLREKDYGWKLIFEGPSEVLWKRT